MLSVGRLVEAKRLDDLLSACGVLAAGTPHLAPEVRIVGDGPARARLEAFAAAAHPRTVFLGARYGEELEREFRRADVFALPGQVGLAVQEALGHGLPVIAGEGDHTQDAIATGQGGDGEQQHGGADREQGTGHVAGGGGEGQRRQGAGDDQADPQAPWERLRPHRPGRADQAHQQHGRRGGEGAPPVRGLRETGDQGRIREALDPASPSRPYLLGVVEQLAAQISIQNIKSPKMPKLEILS